MTLNYSYCVGGSLAWDDPSYVVRDADEHLYTAIHQGLFSRVLGPRQTGKSSLRVRTAYRLAQQGIRCASVQATQLGLGLAVERAAQPSSQWVIQLISSIWDSLYPCEYQALSQWLENTRQLTATARLDAFTQTILLKGADRLASLQSSDAIAPQALRPEAAPPKTVIFIDEIDYLLAFPEAASVFFKWVSQCYQDQQSYQDQSMPGTDLAPRLTFVILGTAIAADIDSYLPHQQTDTVSLENFQLSKVQALSQGFQDIVEAPMDVMKAIFCWTNGQPFLTQKLCRIVFNFLSDLGQAHARTLRISTKALGRWVSHMVDSEIVENWRQKDDPAHLRAMSDRITQSPNYAELRALYQRIAVGTSVVTDGSRLQAELLMSGLAIVCDRQLQFNNEIYRHVFDPLLVNNLGEAIPLSRSVTNRYAALGLWASTASI